MIKYAGIGSRKTPARVLNIMEEFAREAAECGFSLRTGGAIGADEAFLRGAKQARGHYTLYLPWYRYNNHEDNALYIIGQGAMDLAAKYHPAWQLCGPAVKKLHARNGYIVLGISLRDPVDFVVCWTPSGRGEGGTGQALRIAKALDIHCIDLGRFGEDTEKMAATLHD